jgi:hypothetical protein
LLPEATSIHWPILRLLFGFAKERDKGNFNAARVVNHEFTPTSTEIFSTKRTKVRGLVMSTLFTVVAIPIVYTLIDKRAA